MALPDDHARRLCEDVEPKSNAQAHMEDIAIIAIRPAITRCDVRGNRDFECEWHPDPDLLHRHRHLRAIGLRGLLLAVRLRPFPAEEPGVDPPDPGVLGAVQRDPATD